MLVSDHTKVNLLTSSAFQPYEVGRNPLSSSPKYRHLLQSSITHFSHSCVPKEGMLSVILKCSEVNHTLTFLLLLAFLCACNVGGVKPQNTPRRFLHTASKLAS